METRLYNCEYCKKDFLPSRRKVQKFCARSCRVKSHHQKTRTSKALTTINSGVQTEKTSIEKMSLAGVGNSAIGSAAVDLIKHAFTSEENKHATKKDIQNIAVKLQRYQKVRNMNPNFNGQLPYFDIEYGFLVYR
jgi:hypothetical protein